MAGREGAPTYCAMAATAGKSLVRALVKCSEFVYAVAMARTLGSMGDLPASAAGDICPGMLTEPVRSLETHSG